MFCNRHTPHHHGCVTEKVCSSLPSLSPHTETLVGLHISQKLPADVCPSQVMGKFFITPMSLTAKIRDFKKKCINQNYHQVQNTGFSITWWQRFHVAVAAAVAAAVRPTPAADACASWSSAASAAAAARR